ncbi:hypothetical protein [Amycolatopsis sp. cmx-4-68]|uniref:hypothetical protein n=1 Tax=Amycolatopsis sp. cmx-4-68 TaxID=2790938 RepID=UPI00397E913B
MTGQYRAHDLRQLDALADFESAVEHALTVAYPWCWQPPAARCVYPGTDEPLHRAPAHWQRIRAADHSDPTTRPDQGVGP